MTPEDFYAKLGDLLQQAADEWGESDVSKFLSRLFGLRRATPPDVTPPTVPSSVSATVLSATSVRVSWNTSVDTQTGTGGYTIYRDNVAVGTVSAPTTQYTDTNLLPVRTYNYRVNAYDRATPTVNTSNKSALVSATTDASPVDTTPPTVPANVTATPNSQTVIQLTWDASSDAGSGVQDYRVYSSADGYTSPIATVTSPTLAYTLTGLTASTGYSYKVSARDGAPAHNESAKSLVASATTLAADPGVAVRINVGGDLFVDSQGITWLADTGFLDGSSVATYANGTVVTNAAYNRYPIFLSERYGIPHCQFQIPNGDYTLNLYFIDHTIGSGDNTDLCNIASISFNGTVIFTNQNIYTIGGQHTVVTLTHAVTVTNGTADINFGVAIGLCAIEMVGTSGGIADTVPPTVPTSLATSNPTASSVTLTWTASTDAGTGVGGYHIKRDGVIVGTTQAAAYTDTGLASSTTYGYTINAYDLATPPNESSYTGSVSGTTTVNVTPTIPGAFVVSYTGGNAVISSSGSTGQTSYQIERLVDAGSFSLLVEQGSPNYTDTTTSVNHSYSYRMRAKNSTGPVYSAYTSTVTISTSQNIDPGTFPTAYLLPNSGTDPVTGSRRDIRKLPGDSYTCPWNVPISYNATFSDCWIRPIPDKGSDCTVFSGQYFLKPSGGEWSTVTVWQHYDAPCQMNSSAPMVDVRNSPAGESGDNRCSSTSGTMFQVRWPSDVYYNDNSQDAHATFLGDSVQYGTENPPRHTTSFAHFIRCPNVSGYITTDVSGYYDYFVEHQDIYGTGLERGSHGASQLPALWGCLRAGECISEGVTVTDGVTSVVGTGYPRHAVALNVGYYFMKVVTDPYSRSSVGWMCVNNGPYTGEYESYGVGNAQGTLTTLKMGDRVAIPYTVDLSQQTFFTEFGTLLAKALQIYGGVIVDTNHGSEIDPETEWGGTLATNFYSALQQRANDTGALGGYLQPWALVRDTPTGRGQPGNPTGCPYIGLVAEDMNTMARLLKVVSNDSSSTIGGGTGNRLAPPTP